MKADVARVASEAGVSTATVSRVLNGFPGVKPETRDHVGRVLARLGYRPEGRGGRVVGLIVDGERGLSIGPYESQLLSAVTEHLGRTGYAWDMVPVGQATSVRDRAFHGAVVISHRPEVVARVDGLEMDRLFLLNQNHPQAHVIASDHRGQMALAVAHLAELGHHRVTLVRGTSDGWGAREREAGFSAGCQKNGIEGLVQEVPASRMGTWCQERGWGACTAVIAVGEELALPVMAGLLQSNVEPGRDLSLVLMESQWITPHLEPEPTVIEQNFEGMAASLSACIRDLPQRGEKSMTRRRLLVKPKLRVGRTTRSPGG